MELENRPNLSCILCNCDFTSENDMLLHVSSPGHLKNRELKLKDQENPNAEENNQNISSVLAELFCEVCKVAVPCANSMNSHKKGRKHLNQLRILENKRKIDCELYIRGFAIGNEKALLEFLNTFGKIEWHSFRCGDFIIRYQTEESVNNLLKEPRFFQGKRLMIRKNLKTRKAQIIDDAKRDSNSFNFDSIINQLQNVANFDEQISILLCNIKPDLNKYHEVCSDMNIALLRTFPYNRVHLFGSTVTGLNFANSDIDVYISGVRPHNDDQVRYLFKTKNILENSTTFGNIVVIKTAKTPILKCTHVPTNIKVDVNFRSMLGVCNSYLISAYTNLDEKIRIMFIIIKCWTKCRKMMERNRLLTSYVMCILAIFYLQCRHNLPSVFMLQQNCREDLHEGWNGAVTPISKEYTPQESVLELLKGFFKFYADFDYKNKVICPYLGRSFCKTDFLENDDTCQYFKPIVIEKRDLLSLTSFICIQDPMEHTRNPTARMSQENLELFVSHCQLCYELCENNTECVLYKILTTECQITESLSLHSFHFTMLMVYVNTPPYLSKIYPSSDYDIYSERRCWCNAVVDFVRTVMKEFFHFEITEMLDDNVPSSSKQLKVEGQDDVYSKRNDKIVLICSGNLTLWTERERYAKCTELKNNMTLVEREKAITAQMIKTFGRLSVNNLIKFSVSMDFILDPCQVKFELIKIHALHKRTFITFANYFKHKFPFWFRLYEKDLNKTC